MSGVAAGHVRCPGQALPEGPYTLLFCDKKSRGPPLLCVVPADPDAPLAGLAIRPGSCSQCSHNVGDNTVFFQCLPESGLSDLTIALDDASRAMGDRIVKEFAAYWGLGLPVRGSDHSDEESGSSKESDEAATAENDASMPTECSSTTANGRLRRRPMIWPITSISCASLAPQPTRGRRAGACRAPRTSVRMRRPSAS